MNLQQSLIQRSYRDDVPPSYIERFLPLILEMEEDNVPVTPCFSDEGVNYMHIRHNNLYCEHCVLEMVRKTVELNVLSLVLALSKKNSNAVEVIFFLHRLCSESPFIVIMGFGGADHTCRSSQSTLKSLKKNRFETTL